MTDARTQALTSLDTNNLEEGFVFVYGTGDLCKSFSEFDNQRFLLDWNEVNQYIEKNKGKYICGYLGFHLNFEGQRGFTQDSFLATPRVVKKFSGIERSGVVSAPPCIDTSEIEESYIDLVQLALAWIGNTNRRATVAVNIPLDDNKDLSKVLLSAKKSGPYGRTFYFHSNDFSMAGHSPELLAEGTTSQFKTYKLSGTAPVEKGSDFLIHDQKLQNEHKSSASSVRSHLLELGHVEQQFPEVIELDHLSHLMSIFETTPRIGTSIVDCLKSIFPSGVRPKDEGLEFIKTNESVRRGAYYGLVGYISPSGHFEFSQVIRTYFDIAGAQFVWVGAAVTRDSTPQGEFEEITTKLKNFPVL